MKIITKKLYSQDEFSNVGVSNEGKTKLILLAIDACSIKKVQPKNCCSIHFLPKTKIKRITKSNFLCKKRNFKKFSSSSW